MITSKPISTICWSHREFITYTLDTLVESNKIDFYCAIKHFAEDKELSDHYHIFMIPSYKIDTNYIKKSFHEDLLFSGVCLSSQGGLCPCDDKQIPDNDISVISSNKPTSNDIHLIKTVKHFEDWFFYALHDLDYLNSKGLEKKYHYHDTDFFYSDKATFLEIYLNLDRSKFSKIALLKTCIQKNYTFSKVCDLGLVPIQQTVSYERMYESLWREVYIRFRILLRFA